MIVNIYDVGHGFCGYVRDELTGANLLLDCGYNEHTGFHPVDEILRVHGSVGGLVIQNFDEDHMDGLPHFIERVGLNPSSVLITNPSITASTLFSLKDWPYGDGLLAMLSLMSAYSYPVPWATGRSESPGECYRSHYWNPHPTFDDTNNLSLVTFVHGPDYSLIFAGDLERDGWLALLRNSRFRSELARVQVFVASHHGRESGYCAEVFSHCSPAVVIISDSEIIHDSQINCYAKHVTGIPWNGGKEWRKVLTTRCDGHIRIAPKQGVTAFITTSAA